MNILTTPQILPLTTTATSYRNTGGSQITAQFLPSGVTPDSLPYENYGNIITLPPNANVSLFSQTELSFWVESASPTTLDVIPAGASFSNGSGGVTLPIQDTDVLTSEDNSLLNFTATTDLTIATSTTDVASGSETDELYTALTSSNNNVVNKVISILNSLTETFFVSNTLGNDSTGNGTQTTPYKTLSKALQMGVAKGFSRLTVYLDGVGNPTYTFSTNANSIPNGVVVNAYYSSGVVGNITLNGDNTCVMQSLTVNTNTGASITFTDSVAGVKTLVATITQSLTLSNTGASGKLNLNPSFNAGMFTLVGRQYYENGIINATATGTLIISIFTNFLTDQGVYINRYTNNANPVISGFVLNDINAVMDSPLSNTEFLTPQYSTQAPATTNTPLTLNSSSISKGLFMSYATPTILKLLAGFVYDLNISVIATENGAGTTLTSTLAVQQSTTGQAGTFATVGNPIPLNASVNNQTIQASRFNYKAVAPQSTSDGFVYLRILPTITAPGGYAYQSLAGGSVS